MPRRAWIEIHDKDGTLIASIESRIDGGAVTTTLPSFEPARMGVISLLTEYADGKTYREAGELERLPTNEVVHVVQIG